MRIQEIETFKDVATALNIKTGHLRRLLFEEKDNLYSEFQIPKKDGSFRTIYAPSKELLFIQKRLLIILENSVAVHQHSYGFVKGKSTVDNAQLHLKKNFLLNIDLENFFPSISSARVRSMFLKYFKLNNSVSSTLTNLCCHPDGFLPQGAPTSPIISNILCKTLDRELHKLAKKSFGSSYSRYADDISFSSNRLFKDNIVIENNGNLVLGSSLIEIISRNGFKINKSKVRLQKSNQHQEVTGIVVNNKLNVDRRYIRKIRAMLHSIENNIGDLTIPVKKFSESEYKGDTIERLFMVIKGMIDYLGMVRGKDDIIFGNFAKKFNLLLEKVEIETVKPIFNPNILENNVCVIKYKEVIFFNEDKSRMETLDYGQGSGFLLKGYGIVSNYHVFEGLFDLGYLDGLLPQKDTFLIQTFFGENATKLIKAKIDKYSKEKDIILLKPEDSSLLVNGFNRRDTPLLHNEEIRLLGYPDYHDNDELKYQTGNYIRIVNDGIKNFEISTPIFGGNSGGPVLDSNNLVVGIATSGRNVEINKAVPIEYIDDLTNFEF